MRPDYAGKHCRVPWPDRLEPSLLQGGPGEVRRGASQRPRALAGSASVLSRRAERLLALFWRSCDWAVLTQGLRAFARELLAALQLSPGALYATSRVSKRRCCCSCVSLGRRCGSSKTAAHPPRGTDSSFRARPGAGALFSCRLGFFLGPRRIATPLPAGIALLEPNRSPPLGRSGLDPLALRLY